MCITPCRWCYSAGHSSPRSARREKRIESRRIVARDKAPAVFRDKDVKANTTTLAAMIKTEETLVEKSREAFTSAWYSLSVNASACLGLGLKTSFTTNPALSNAGARCHARFPEPMKEIFMGSDIF